MAAGAARPQPLLLEGTEGAEFSIRLQNPRKSPSSLGLHVDVGDGRTLVVEHVAASGAVAARNAQGGEPLAVGDQIVSVNGLTGDAVGMANALGRHEVLDLAVRRSGARAAGGGTRSAAFAGWYGTSAPRSARAAYLPAAVPAAASLACSLRSENDGDGRASLSTKTSCTPSAAAGGRCEQPDEHCTLPSTLTAKAAPAQNPNARAAEVTPFGNLFAPQGKPTAGIQAAAAVCTTAAMMKGVSTELDFGRSRWFQVVHQPHVASRLEPNFDAPMYFTLDYGELFEATDVQDGWVRLTLRELRRRELFSNDWGDVSLGHRVRATCALRYQCAVVPEDAWGTVVSLEPCVGVRWDGFRELTDAVVYSNQIITRQAWVPTGAFRELGLGGAGGAAVREAPAPPPELAEAGGIIRWDQAVDKDHADENLAEQEAHARWSAARASQEAVERVVVENDKAWELLQKRRRRELQLQVATSGEDQFPPKMTVSRQVLS